MGIDVINYKCPNCAAPMAFGIGSQKWECHFCFSTFTKEELDQIEANEGESLSQASWEAEAFPEEDTRAFTCPDCGGRMLTDPNTTATFCVYCHNPTVIASRLTGEYRPARLIPFQHPKEDAITSVQQLCKGKVFLPSAFRDAVENGEVEGLYVPYWLFSEQYNSHLIATGKRFTVWRDSKYEYTKTDIYNVERQAFIPVDKVPIDASKRMDDALMEAIEPYDYSQMVPFSMEYLSGHFAETFDVDAAVSAQRFKTRVDAHIETYMRQQANMYPSLTVHSLSTSGRARDNLYVLLPVWTVSVKYKEKIYTYAMNGQTGRSAGRLPVSVGRVFAWLGGLFGVFYILSVLVGGFL